MANGVIYAASNDGYFHALNALTGAQLWSKLGYGGSAAVTNGAVYVSSSGNNIAALNALTGAQLWSYATGGYVGASAPAVANGVVYVGSGDNNLYALNAATGAKLWSYATNGSVGTPIVANGVVYVGSADNNVYALNASSGAKLWSYATAYAVGNSPAVANGKLYVASGSIYSSGEIYVFHLPSAMGADEDASAPPDLTTLQPNYSLPPSQLAAMQANNDEN